MTPEEIKVAVRAKYSQVAKTPTAEFNFPGGREFAESVGYPKALSDASLDIVASNGIYNLSPQKEPVMREVFRVLKPGGRTTFAEVVLKSALPDEVRKSVKDWFRCIGGALPETDLLTLMKKVGFERIEVLAKGCNARTGHELALCATIRAYKPRG